jgi:hypothetical protein
MLDRLLTLVVAAAGPAIALLLRSSRRTRLQHRVRFFAVVCEHDDVAGLEVRRRMLEESEVVAVVGVEAVAGHGTTQVATSRRLLRGIGEIGEAA